MKRQTDKGGRVIWLAGLPLKLNYSVNSLCAMEKQAGMPLDELMKHHFSATRLLLWAGLYPGYPGLTVWDAGELISKHLQRGGTLDEVVTFCADALRASGLLEGDGEEA